VQPRRIVTAWLLLGALLIAAMVSVGGITRLTGSGLSITEWRPVTGAVPPLSQAAWEAEFAKYKTSPQFLKTNPDFQLDDFKRIYFWEYLHRLLGRFIGLFFVAPLVFFWRKKWVEKWLGKRVLLLVVLGGFQGLLGWLMVKSGLVNVPAVSHERLAAHLLTALVTFALTLWTALELNAGRTDATPRPGAWTTLAKTALGLVAVVFLQVGFGAFVAGLRAGFVYTTWPTMSGEWMPEAVGATSPFWRDVLENPVTVQFIHRWLGFAVTLLVGAWVAFAWKRAPVRRAAQWLGGAVLLQYTLGALTIVNFIHHPVWWGSVHQLGAVALLSASVVALFAARRESAQPVAVTATEPATPEALDGTPRPAV